MRTAKYRTYATPVPPIPSARRAAATSQLGKRDGPAVRQRARARPRPRSASRAPRRAAKLAEPARVERRDRVAESRGDDGDRGKQFAARLHADEQRDATEADEQADEAPAAHPVAAAEAEREQGRERGAAAWRTAASPESIRVSAQARAVIGSVELTSAAKSRGQGKTPAHRRPAAGRRERARQAGWSAPRSPVARRSASSARARGHRS